MTSSLRLTLTFAALAAGLCFAQTGDDAVPASSNSSGAQYPRIHPDLRITFQVAAPGALKVQVQPGGADSGLGPGPYDMTKDDKGVWTVTTPPAVPGFHYYWLVIDGAAVSDPGSQNFFGWGKQCSGVEVPDKSLDFYDTKDVPHGEIHIKMYHSKVTNAWRQAYVYTPHGYSLGSARYPVLYLSHGSGEDGTTWPKQGRANLIMDNLIAAGKAKPMLVVMDTAYATKYDPVLARRPSDAQPAPAPVAGQGARPAPDAFEDVLVTDLIPMVDASYRTLPDRLHRAITGTSRGGSQSLQFSSKHLDLFAWIGAFSAPPINNFNSKTSLNGVFADPAAYNRKVHLLWIGAGTLEERMHKGAKDLDAALTEAGVKHVYYESVGTSHEFQTWRKDLREFAPLLFRDLPQPKPKTTLPKKGA